MRQASRRLRTLSRSALLAMVGLLSLAVVAVAMIPDSGGVIHGCYSKSGGSIRVIDNTSTKCGNNETSLDWNQKGQQGLQGPAGPKGDTGPIGPAGPKGDRGDKGDKGDKGDPCLASDPACVGPKGNNGDPGPAGPAGPAGTAGAVGPAGPTGPTGPTGPSGASNTTFIVVNADATKRYGSAGLTSKDRVTPFCFGGFCEPDPIARDGQYEVDSVADISQCALTGNVAANGTAAPGVVQADFIDAHSIRVDVRNSTDGSLVRGRFHLVITC